MNIIESIELLIKANKKYISNQNNNRLLEKRDKLRYYLLIGIKNSPEKSFVLKTYLEKKMSIMTKENNDFSYIVGLYKEIDNIYIESLKDLTLNEKRRFFEKTRNKELVQKDMKERVYAYII